MSWIVLFSVTPGHALIHMCDHLSEIKQQGYYKATNKQSPK